MFMGKQCKPKKDSKNLSCWLKVRECSTFDIGDGITFKHHLENHRANDVAARISGILDLPGDAQCHEPCYNKFRVVPVFHLSTMSP